MAVIRKLRKKWQVIIRRKDHPQLSKVFISKEAAREWARDTEVNIEQSKLLPIHVLEVFQFYNFLLLVNLAPSINMFH